MFPILGRYGSFFLYSYTVCLAVALLAGWLWLRRHSQDPGWPLAVLWAALIGLLAGRAAFVDANWSYFASHRAEILLIGQGGLAAQPFVLTTLLCLYVYQRRRPNLRSPWGSLSVPLPLIYLAGWLACYLEGCAYGAETTLHALAADLPDNYGVFALRYQTQLVGAAGALLTLLLALYWHRRYGLRSDHFWLLLALLGAQQIALLPWRGDPAPLWFGWRADLYLGLLALLAGVAGSLSHLARRSELCDH